MTTTTTTAAATTTAIKIIATIASTAPTPTTIFFPLSLSIFTSMTVWSSLSLSFSLSNHHSLPLFHQLHFYLIGLIPTPFSPLPPLPSLSVLHPSFSFLVFPFLPIHFFLLPSPTFSLSQSLSICNTPCSSAFYYSRFFVQPLSLSSIG